jgi:hypothetical protein
MLEDLGIAYTDARGNARDMEEVLLDSAVAIGRVQNPTEKLTLANDLLGKGGRKLATNFKGTREEMLATIEAAGELGGIYSDDFVKASAEANDELEAAERQYATLRSEIVMVVLPALRWLVRSFGAVARAVRSFLGETKVLDRWLKLLPAILAGIGLKLLIANFAQVGAWLVRVGKLLLPFAKLILPFIAWALILDDLIVFLEGGDSALGALLGRVGVPRAAVGIRVFDVHHARHGLGLCGVDAVDAAVGEAAAHEAQEKLAGGHHVIGVAALALHQRRVFDAAHGVAAAVAAGLGEAVGRVHAVSCESVVLSCCSVAAS